MNTKHSLLVSVLFSLFIFSNALYAQAVVQTIPLPNTTYWNQAYGVAADSNFLYLSSSTSTTSAYNYGFIYKLDWNGNVVDSINPSRGASQGIAFDGTNFYYVRRYTATSTIVKLNTNGTLVDSLRFSGKYIGGITWDGSHVWVSEYYPSDGKLYKINWSTKSIIDSFATIGAQPTGVAWDGNNIYYAMDYFSSEPNKNLIYVVNPSNGDTIQTIQMPDNNPNGDMNPRGLAINGRYMWLVAKPLSAPTGQVLYKYDLGSTGPVINVPERTFNIGNVNIGTTLTAIVTVQNNGTGNLTVDSVHNLYSSQFTTNLTPPYTIPPGLNLQFTIFFAPQTFGEDSAYFILYNNDVVRGAQTVKAYGKGIQDSVFINVPSSYEYGTRRVGSSTKWNLKIENQGTNPLIVDSAEIFSFVGGYYIQEETFPVTIPALSSVNVRIWFNPHTAGTSGGSLHLYNNSSNAPDAEINLTGTGEPSSVAIGVPLWNYTVANHPISNTGRLVKAVRAFNDITGDGKPDMIVSTENYWTMAVNGNGSGDTDSLWAFTSYISNYSAGSIGTVGDYSHQKALEIASDLNGDGFNDVVIGTGGGNEHVYALNGKTGAMLWTFGTDAQDSFSLGDFTGVDVKRDFNNDGVPDVVAVAAATETGGVGGRRTVYLFDGTNGTILWMAPLLGFTHGIISIDDMNNDNIPDVVGTVGEPSYKAVCFSGANGATLWSFSPPSSGSAKEVMEFPVAGEKPDVILGAFWGPVFRLNGETGTQLWSHSTGGDGVMQLSRLRDVTGDSVDEILVALLTGGARCINGADGSTVWSLFGSENTMGCASISDLNGDGIDEAIFVVQNVGTYILRGNNGQQFALYPATSTAQAREVAVVPDMDGNNSKEIIVGGKLGNVTLLSGGLDAPVSVRNDFLSTPTQFSLSNNYPNPFNPTTTFRLSVPQLANVEISIYNILGEKVKTMLYENLAVGSHEIKWNGTNDNEMHVASGVYLLKVKVSSSSAVLFTATKRLMLVK
ncbi:MAG: choice-of-anchor D domain-containing protein [Ignavibacteriales bacterium]|nr:choice-of-anchor D domain-containing protein [Ignavibacteriales bacterium]